MTDNRRKGATIIGFIAGILVAHTMGGVMAGDWPWVYLNSVLFLLVLPTFYDSLRQP